MDTLSLLKDFPIRQAVGRVDKITCEILQTSWPLIHPCIPIAVEEFLDQAAKIGRVAPIIAEHRKSIAQFLTSHFEILFQAKFDGAYADSCVETGAIERTIGIGGRSRVILANYLFDELVKRFSRKSLFSSKFSTFATAFTRVLFFDIANTMIVHEDLAKKDAEARILKIDEAIAEFNQTIGGAVSEIKQASVSLVRASDTMQELSLATQISMNIASESSSKTTADIKATAAATDQISSSIQGIRVQTDRSLAVARSVAEGADKTTQAIKLLADSVEKVGSIIGVISKIASQTNLLALNATIEAARAGQAGKGFNVVASEVKILAAQTSRATDDISSQIASIQGATSASVHEIAAIAKIINDLMAAASINATTVLEQEHATEQIAANVHSAVLATQHTEEELQGLARISSNGLTVSENVLELTRRLSSGAANVEQSVEEFFVRVRSAQ